MSDLNKYFDILGVSASATASEQRDAYLKRLLKWFPGKDNSNEAKMKIKELTEAYDILVAPKVKMLDNGRVVKVTLDTKRANLLNSVVTKPADKKHGLFGRVIQSGMFRWFTSDGFSTSVNDRIDDALELFSDYMYDGEVGEYFVDEDSQVYVVADITLSRALIGGKVTYDVKVPGRRKTKHTDEIPGILDGAWIPIKKILIGKEHVWVIYKVCFPGGISEEEETELREKLLFMQVSSLFISRFDNWFKHPAIIATVASAVMFGILAIFKKLPMVSQIMHMFGMETTE